MFAPTTFFPSLFQSRAPYVASMLFVFDGYDFGVAVREVPGELEVFDEASMKW